MLLPTGLCRRILCQGGNRFRRFLPVFWPRREELKNSVAQSLNIVFLFPVIEEQQRQLVGNIAVVIGIVVFTQVFLRLTVKGDGIAVI